jgi:hypothetical protein
LPLPHMPEDPRVGIFECDDLTMPPPCSAGICWYWPAKLYSPIVRRILSRIASGWRSGCSASPRHRVREYHPSSVSSP